MNLSTRSLQPNPWEPACPSVSSIGETLMPETINENRRRVLAAAITTIAAAQVPKVVAADAPAGGPKGTFGPLKQINAGLLNVGYVEMGPAGGSPVFLLHGWPYDIHSFVDVAPLLASAGYRVIVPF